LQRLPGKYPLRLAERQKLAEEHQPPPRNELWFIPAAERVMGLALYAARLHTGRGDKP